jgi:hypothetical protein
MSQLGKERQKEGIDVGWECLTSVEGQPFDRGKGLEETAGTGFDVRSQHFFERGHKTSTRTATDCKISTRSQSGGPRELTVNSLELGENLTTENDV